MRRSRLAVVVIPLCGLLLAASASFAEGIPDRLQNVEDPSGPLAWISGAALRQAMDAADAPKGSSLQSVDQLGYLEGGRLDWSLDPDEFEIAPDGTLICNPPPLTRPLTYYQGKQARNISELVELSKAIVSVRVVGSEQGLINGRYAGELIELEVLSVLKDIGAGAVDALGPAPPAPSDGGLYVFDYYARMIIDGRALCLGTRQVPRGDFILFLIQTRPSLTFPLPLFGLDGSALVAADGSFYGTLLDPHRPAPQDELARQLADFEKIIAEAKP